MSKEDVLTCSICHDASASITLSVGESSPVCQDCARKARLRTLVNSIPADTSEAVLAYEVEHLYSLEGIAETITGEADRWKIVETLDSRLVEKENTQDRVRDCVQHFQQIWFDKLVEMESDSDLHVLVGRAQYLFKYDSKDFETKIRQDRKANRVVDGLIEEPDAWPEPVDGPTVANEMVEGIHRHVRLTRYEADTVVLWSLFTHGYDVFDICPNLGVESPTHRCGKTTLMKILGQYACRSILCSNISDAALFHTIEKWHPTLLMDEGDTFLTDPNKKEQRGIINSGHTRETAFVIRSGTKEQDYDPVRYSTWAPKCIALIGKLPVTVADRTIPIKLKRVPKADRPEKLRRHHLIALKPLYRRIARWVADHREALAVERKPLTLEGLDDRQADNWDVLVWIADNLGGDWPVRARKAAIALSGDTTEDTAGVELLRDLRRYFSGDNKEKKQQEFTDRLLKWLNADTERPWASWNRGKGMTAKNLGSLLRPFGIKSESIRDKDVTGKGYKLDDDLRDAFERYLDPPPSPDPPFSSVTPSQVNNNGNLDPEISRHKTPDVTDQFRVLSTRKDSDVTGVTDENGVSQGGKEGHIPKTPVIIRRPADGG